MARTIWAVESGEYSDHSLHALFETEELAQRYLDALVEAGVRYEASWQGVGLDRDYEANSIRNELSIVPYQLWDVLPVVEDGPRYAQDHTEPPPVAESMEAMQRALGS